MGLKRYKEILERDKIHVYSEGNRKI